jgi:hypothetical protein
MSLRLEEEEEEEVRNYVVMQVPEDARLDQSFRRNFHHTSLGMLCEIVIKRR